MCTICVIKKQYVLYECFILQYSINQRDSIAVASHLLQTFKCWPMLSYRVTECCDSFQSQGLCLIFNTAILPHFPRGQQKVILEGRGLFFSSGVVSKFPRDQKFRWSTRPPKKRFLDSLERSPWSEKSGAIWHLISEVAIKRQVECMCRGDGIERAGR